MSTPDDRLYNLLPAVYRQRDAALGGPLQQLLQVVAEQVDAVENDIRQLYDNWFIETCQDWVVPYLADLIGYQPVHSAGNPVDLDTAQALQLSKILVPRRDVANTPHFRRRKGTLALLEELAAAAAGWPARAVEFFRLLAILQDIGRPGLALGHTVDVRAGDALDRFGGAFDGLAHRPDVRGIASHLRRGRFNLPNVGLFVWRLRAYRVSKTAAYSLANEGRPHYYTFSVLGNTAPLFTGPGQRLDPAQPPELAFPTPIRRRALGARAPDHPRAPGRASADYYGADRSLAVWVANWPKKDPKAKDGNKPIRRQLVIPADLSHWTYAPPRNHIAVDPVLGLIAFPADQLPREHVYVSYYYGFNDDLGGGEYDRPLTPYAGDETVRVSSTKELRHALEDWQRQPPPRRVIEIDASGVYVGHIHLEMTKPDQVLEIRAANGVRPVIRLLDWQTDLPNSLTVRTAPGATGCRFILDGLLVTGHGVRVEGGIAEVVLRHTTLVPGWGLHPHCEPARPTEPSLELHTPLGRAAIERSILGTIQVTHDDQPRDPFPIVITDSILDSADPELAAVEAPGCLAANVRLTVRRCTVLGSVEAHALDLAENSIFMGRLCVAGRQQGCVRFCYVPPGSRTPRRYHCQPDLVDPQGANPAERSRVRPQFTSTRYGTPGYVQLAEACAPEIIGGADDESEMGAFHDLFQPQRAANLSARLAEFTPAATEAGIIYET